LEKRTAPIAKGIVISIISGVLSAALGAYSVTALLVAPAFLSRAFSAWGYGVGAVGLISYAATAYLVGGASASVYMMACVLPASFAIGFIIMKKKPWRTAVSLGALLMGLGLYANICLPSILQGLEPFAGIAATVSEVSSELAAALEAGGASADTIKLIKLLFADAEEYAGKMTMQYLTAGSMIAALIDTLIARSLTRRVNNDIRPMAPMPLWQLSNNYNYAAGFALLGAVVTLIAGLNNADAVLSVAENVIMGPLALMGFCYLDFLTKIGRPGSKAKRIVLYIFVIVFPGRTTVLALVGLLDRIMKVRRRYVPSKRNSAAGSRDNSDRDNDNDKNGK
jgi:uncharacterized protein YybS (DUF2232 family)